MQLMTAKADVLTLDQIVSHQKLLAKEFDNVKTNVLDGYWIITGELKGKEVADEQV